ncbi:MAG: ankyrin repeat domain-containing protein [Endozoicomonas sp. (ex Botrylloides leachii)]|nr:ankyrin repeat domain-containing protein [Endozoicomonas sp. (ex Botrylloides leachii)]
MFVHRSYSIKALFKSFFLLLSLALLFICNFSQAGGGEKSEEFLNACMSGDLSKVQNYLSSGADFNAAIDGLTGLMLAACKGHTEIAELLIENGANINAAGENGWTALMLAAENNKKEVVKLLIGKGANVNAMRENGWTPMISTAQNNHKVLVELLIDRGASVNAMRENVVTALMSAAYSSSPIKMS